MTTDTYSPDWAARHARQRPDALALVDVASARRFTYADLDRRATQLAAAMARDFGVSAGDRIAILSHNDTNLFEVQFAAWRLGASYVPLNWRLTVPELAYILDDCQPRVLLHGADFADAASELAAQCAIAARIAWGAACPGAADYEALLCSRADAVPITQRNTHATLACVMYTSGTTGQPKGAMITHGGMTWNLLSATAPWRFGEGMVNLTVLPLFHIGGINAFANPALHYGGTSYVMRSFDPGATLAALSDPTLGVTHFIGVPTNYLFMSQHPDFATARFPTLATAGIGGSPASVALLETWAGKGVILQQGYGMTESAGTISVQSRDDAARKIGSVGTPLMHLEHRIVDASGADVAPGEVGELLVRAPNISPGYWQRPDANSQSFKAGYLRTGDAVREDADGHLYILDRWKDMYISGGENVYPAEVENVIYQLPEVGEVAVIGMPDAQWGEVGRAVIVLQVDAELSAGEVLRHCAGRLARYKLPRSVVFVDQLPHNATGKLLKRELRARFLDGAA